MVSKFHGNVENYYSSSYGLLQENSLPEKFGGDITLTNILLPEVGSHMLTHLSTERIHDDNSVIKRDSVKRSEKELKRTHKLYSKFKFSKNKDCIYSKQCMLVFLAC